MILGHMHELEVWFAERLPDNRRDFGVGEVALSQQFAGLVAVDGWVQESLGRRGCDVASGDHGKFQIRTERGADGAHLADRVHLRERVFHEVAGAQVKHIRAADLVEFLFEIVKAQDGAGAAGG